MKSEILIAVLILGLFSAIVGTRVYAFDNHDFQVWNTDVEEFKVNKSSKLVLEEEFRFGKSASDFYYQHYDLGYVHDLNNYLNLGFGYRHINEMKNSKFREENEPYGMATLFWGLAGFKFDDRSRLEYRYFDYQVSSWRYRNKFTARSPWNFTKMKIQPYICDEFFFKFNGIDINENRFSAGLGLNLTKNIKGEIYYMLRSTKNPGICTWSDTNVLGTKFKISF